MEHAVEIWKLRGKVLVTKKDVDAIFRKVKQLSEMVETAGKWLSEGWYERRTERNERVNPEEVVEGDSMDWEWEKGNEPSMDEQMRNLREKMVGMSLRVERLERNMPLGCEESGSTSGGGEGAWWSGAWWVKAGGKCIVRSVSRWESQVREIGYVRRKRQTRMMMKQGGGVNWEWRLTFKRSRRVRNEQAKFEKGTANFRNASKADGACVNTLGCSSGGDFCFQRDIVEFFWATMAFDIACVTAYVRVRTFSGTACTENGHSWRFVEDLG